jgi:CheY-like chemotaxis protein
MTKRILVVEDQEDNRQIIRDMLTFTDYEIMEAETGEAALEAVAKQRSARSHSDGYPIAGHGWLRGDAQDQDRPGVAFDHDHSGYFLCAQWGRTEGTCGGLR